MTQEELKKFWKGLYPDLHLSDDLLPWIDMRCRVAEEHTRCWINSAGQIVFCGEVLPDPADAEKVRLEVLIKGLHKLCAAADVDCWIDVRGNILSLYGLATMEFCRASIIAAISKLLKEADNVSE